MPPINRKNAPNPTNATSVDVAVVGGGLAGMAASLALSQQGLRVALLESRSTLGGRASSFRDPSSGETLDFCQHVSMRCCSHLADFCRRLEIQDRFTCLDRLLFADTEGRQSTIAATRWLPAPLHLGPALLGLKHLRFRDRSAIARAMWALMRVRPTAQAEATSFLDWLTSNRQSAAAIDGFWHVVLVSALAETLDRVSLAAGRKVFVDGFMASRRGYEVLVPDLPLSELFGTRGRQVLAANGADVRTNAAVREICSLGEIHLESGDVLTARHVVLAVAWRRAPALLATDVRIQLPELTAATQLEASPITGIHLWFDRPIMSGSHCVLVGCQSHWLFARGKSAPPGGNAAPAHYYQVVISASRALVGADRGAIIADVLKDLAGPMPTVRSAKLVSSQIVTHREAVFSPLPGCDAFRPQQQTSLPWLLLAGDWTQTDWPATMEGAVRSGYLAAEAILKSLGRESECRVKEQQRAMLPRLLIR